MSFTTVLLLSPAELPAFAMQSTYLFPMLRVAFDQTARSATRITSLYSFASVITGKSSNSPSR